MSTDNKASMNSQEHSHAEGQQNNKASQEQVSHGGQHQNNSSGLSDMMNRGTDAGDDERNGKPNQNQSQ